MLKIFISLIIFLMISDSYCQDNCFQGKWIMTKSEACDGSSSTVHSFPNQIEMSIGKKVSLRFDLFEKSLKYEYEYSVSENILNIIGNSEYQIISCDSTNLILKQRMPDFCYIHYYISKDIIFGKKFSELQYEMIESDTFYISTLTIYPRFIGEDRFIDVIVKNYGQNLKKRSVNLLKITLYLKEDGEVYKAELNELQDKKLEEKIINFLYRTSYQWKIMNVFDWPLNLKYEVTVVI